MAIILPNLLDNPVNESNENNNRNQGKFKDFDEVDITVAEVCPTVTWINPAGGNWNEPSNWETGSLPQQDEHALINRPEDITVTHDTGTNSICSLTTFNKFELTGKNGHRGEKQCYLCQHCGRQFVDSPGKNGYPPEVRQHCLNLHASGRSFRSIERQTGVNRNTVINWVRQEASLAEGTAG